jgi:type IV secretion system protein VirD4
VFNQDKGPAIRPATVAVMLLVAVGVALYLAGYFFLWKMRNLAAPPWTATPWTIVSYWLYWSHLPYTRTWAPLCLLAGAVLSACLFAVLLVPSRRALHGDARFATTREVHKAGLMGDRGLILGKLSGRYLMLPGQVGALCAAPPRSGKGAGLVQPNMLNWPDSVVLLDVRQESFRLTSGFRAKFTDTFLFNPVDHEGRTMQWNPLSYVSDDVVVRIDDLQKIAHMLSPDPAEGDPFWPASCRTLFLGLALYVFETDGLVRTLGEIVRQIMSGEEGAIGEHWLKVIADRDASDQPLSAACKAALYDFIYTSANTQSSIRKTFTAKLELWLNPLVDAATSGNSFDLRDLRKRRISVYIGVRPADLDRLQLILNLFFQQVIDLNTNEMPEDNPDLRYQLLLLMDEFTAVGRMAIFAKAISFLGGYNIRPFLVVQGVSQLRATYGADVAETIVTCCAAVVVYAPKEQKHANEIAESLGDTTVKGKSRSSRPMDMKAASVNVSDQRRQLLKPQEVKGIGRDREIIFIENVRPIFAQKISYWKERAFTRRLLPAVEVPAIPQHGTLPAVPVPPSNPLSINQKDKNAEDERTR